MLKLYKMKRKSKAVKTETQSPYFTNGENMGTALFEEGINDASNEDIIDITEVIFDTLLTNKSETKSKTQDIVSIKRTGKISKYFKSIKKRFTKSVNTSNKRIKFSEEEPFFSSNIEIDSKVDLKISAESISEMDNTSEKEKDLNVDAEETKSSSISKLPTMEEAKKAASIV
ncbi:hypothetical protein C1645_760124, partial [Glomus cerebriforme]